MRRKFSLKSGFDVKRIKGQGQYRSEDPMSLGYDLLEQSLIDYWVKKGVPQSQAEKAAKAAHYLLWKNGQITDKWVLSLEECLSLFSQL